MILESKEREKKDVSLSVGLTLVTLISRLSETSLLTLALKFLERLSPGEDAKNVKFYFAGLFDSNNGIAYRLKPEDRIRVALEVERRCHHEDQEVRKHAFEVMQTFLPHLRPSDFMDLALQIDSAGDEFGLPTLREIIPRMESKDLLVLAVNFANRLKVSSQEASSALDEIIPKLKTGERIKLLAEMIAGLGLRGIPLPVLKNLLQALSAETISALPAKRVEPDFRLLAEYHRTRMPFEPYFWDAYLRPSDYLNEVISQLDEYRRGKRLTIDDERELRLAHAALGAPEGLPYEKFADEVKVESPPFLQRRFEAVVTRVDAVHQKIDKGKIFQALEPVIAVSNAEGLQRQVAELLAREPGAMKKYRGILEESFPRAASGETQDIESIIQSAKRLLPQIWEQRHSPPVQTLLSHLILFLGWHQNGAASLRKKMKKIQDPSVSSETLGTGLRAIEEFYRDSLEDVLRQLRLSAEQIPFLKKQRRLLKAELERMGNIQGESVKVEFLPSKSQADRFFGYVGEDCNKNLPDLIYRRDFQFFRMISDGHLVGMLYLQEARLDGKKVLVMAIQPRSFWRVNHKDLLKAIEKNFSRIGSEEGYDYVLLSANEHQQSNRQDMLKAIANRKFRRVEFKESIQGTVFDEREFLVMWKNGAINF